MLQQTVCNILACMTQNAKEFVFSNIPLFACGFFLINKCFCRASCYYTKSSPEPQIIGLAEIYMSDHRTCNGCSRRYRPCGLCCWSFDILCCDPLGFSFDYPSPLVGDRFCLVDGSCGFNVGITRTSFRAITYLSGRACPGNMSRRSLLLWKHGTSSIFSLYFIQCYWSPLNLGVPRRTCVRLESADFLAISSNRKEELAKRRRSSRSTSALTCQKYDGDLCGTCV